MANWCRVFGIMAAKAPVCVVFRRGPSKWVQMLRWNTRTDVFEPGHWFHGRIYERRSHLSPDGKHLVYFASKITRKQLAKKDYTIAWTAISRPPQFRAEALWPKGDCWHGGGIFLSNAHVLLNHRPEKSQPHPDHLPRGFKITPNADAAGEDSPIHDRILERNGWRRIREGRFEWGGGGIVARRTEIHEKRSPSGRVLRLELKGFARGRYGGDRVEEFSFGTDDTHLCPLEDVRWADLDQRGRLVLARRGRIYRARIRGDRIDETELIDLNPNRPPRLAERNES